MDYLYGSWVTAFGRSILSDSVVCRFCILPLPWAYPGLFRLRFTRLVRLWFVRRVWMYLVLLSFRLGLLLLEMRRFQVRRLRWYDTRRRRLAWTGAALLLVLRVLARLLALVRLLLFRLLCFLLRGRLVLISGG